jgi:MFS family permease
MQSIAELWLVYRLTGSALLLGAAGFASQIPVFLVAPVGGIVADRFNRQRVVIGTQISSMVLALVFATLTLTHLIRVWHIFVLAALLGVVNAFDIPARQSYEWTWWAGDAMLPYAEPSMFNGAHHLFWRDLVEGQRGWPALWNLQNSAGLITGR